jgi:hypothetical protein
MILELLVVDKRHKAMYFMYKIVVLEIYFLPLTLIGNPRFPQSERTHLRISCLGSGPAGLCFAISMELRDLSKDVVVLEPTLTDAAHSMNVCFPVNPKA